MTMLLAIESATLVRSLTIALVVVSPYFLVKWRQVRRVRRAEAAARAEQEAAVAPPPPEPGSTLEEVVATVEAAAERVRGGDPGVYVELRRDITVDGRRAAPEVVDAVVRDTLRRTGLVVTAELDRGEVRLLEVRAARTSG